MSPYLAVFKSDLKQIMRDVTMLMLLIVPFIMLGFINYAIPFIENLSLKLDAYYKIILLTFCIINANFPGYIVSFILLDEKDQNLFPVMKVQPISLTGFLMVRIAFIMLFGFLFSMLLLVFNGLIDFSLKECLFISLLCALTVPSLVLIISFKAKNKVEGMTLMKVFNVTLITPVVLFFIDTPWEYLLGIFPTFWVYKPTESNSLTIYMIGILILTALNILIFKHIAKMATKN